jgi:hypothetical protein
MDQYDRCSDDALHGAKPVLPKARTQYLRAHSALLVLLMSDAQKVVLAFWLMVALLAFAAFSGVLP